MEYPTFITKEPEIVTGYTRGDIILHAFITGLLGFGAAALIYTHIYSAVIQKNQHIHKLEKKIEELEVVCAKEEDRADKAIETENDMRRRVKELEKEVNDLVWPRIKY